MLIDEDAAKVDKWCKEAKEARDKKKSAPKTNARAEADVLLGEKKPKAKTTATKKKTPSAQKQENEEAAIRRSTMEQFAKMKNRGGKAKVGIATQVEKVEGIV